MFLRFTRVQYIIDIRMKKDERMIALKGKDWKRIGLRTKDFHSINFKKERKEKI